MNIDSDTTHLIIETLLAGTRFLQMLCVLIYLLSSLKLKRRRYPSARTNAAQSASKRVYVAPNCPK